MRQAIRFVLAIILQPRAIWLHVDGSNERLILRQLPKILHPVFNPLGIAKRLVSERISSQVGDYKTIGLRLDVL